MPPPPRVACRAPGRHQQCCSLANRFLLPGVVNALPAPTDAPPCRAQADTFRASDPDPAFPTVPSGTPRARPLPRSQLAMRTVSAAVSLGCEAMSMSGQKPGGLSCHLPGTGASLNFTRSQRTQVRICLPGSPASRGFHSDQSCTPTRQATFPHTCPPHIDSHTCDRCPIDVCVMPNHPIDC